MNGSVVFQPAILAAFVFSFPASLMSMDESPKSFPLADGRSVELRSLKEGNYDWFESGDGFAVVRTPDRYEYAFQTEDGGIVASGVMAGANAIKLPFPAGIRPTQEYLRKKRAAGGPAGSPPSPHPVSVSQPGGKTLELYLKGSSGISWYEDKNGYTVVTVSGRLEYAIRNQHGELVGCGVEVDTMKPSEAGLVPGIRPGAEFLKRRNSLPGR